MKEREIVFVCANVNVNVNSYRERVMENVHGNWVVGNVSEME